ncbi:MAG: hypothetical protein Q8M47_06930 [Devosia sp.]|nr:hypothetical protein [Devosia sp.]
MSVASNTTKPIRAERGASACPAARGQRRTIRCRAASIIGASASDASSARMAECGTMAIRRRRSGLISCSSFRRSSVSNLGAE